MNATNWIQILLNHAERHRIPLDEVPAQSLLAKEGFFFTKVMRKAWNSIMLKRRIQSHQGGASPSEVPLPLPDVHPPDTKPPPPAPKPIVVTLEQAMQMEIPEDLREQLIAAIRLQLLLRARVEQLERSEHLRAAMESRIAAASPGMRDYVRLLEEAVLRAKLSGDW